MNVFNLVAVEFSKLAANKAILFSVIGALLVPVVYGTILLNAKWGPYDNLSNLPVAVVNNDYGTLKDGEPLNVGNELVASLREKNSLGFEFVNSTEAMRGLEENKYYLAIVIPEDFSQRAVTVLDADPTKLELEYIQNEGLNFLASKVTESAMVQIRESLANSITETYVATMFSSLEEVAEGFEKAADGSEQLAEGTTQLHDGTNELNASVTAKMGDISKLADGTKQLKEGTGVLLNSLQGKSGDISKLANGSQELHAGTLQILAGLEKAEPGSKKIRDGLYDRLIPGSAAVADGATAIQRGSAQLAAGALELVNGLEEYKKANPTVLVGPYYKQIQDGANKILAGLNTLSSKSVGLADGAYKVSNGLADSVGPGVVALNDGLNQLVVGQRQVVNGAKQVADGNAQVNKGWTDLTQGVTQLESGAAQIYSGNQAVNEGWKTLAAGTSQLNEGAGKVNDGSQQLASGLKEGAEKTSGLNLEKENAQMFSSPVELVADKKNGYQYYRDSTAPYILTLSLMVGILIMSLFINFQKPQFVSSFNWFTAKYVKLASLAILQAIIVTNVVYFGLDLKVTNPLMFFFFAISVSVTFAAIVLFLATFGNIGRFIAVAFIVLQLSITGANLPIEMLPEFYQNVSSFLPFTYAIAGFKSVISLDHPTAAFHNIGFLASYLVVFAGLAYMVFFIKGRLNSKNYNQELAV